MEFPAAEQKRVAAIDAQLVEARGALLAGSAESLLAALQVATALAGPLVVAERRRKMAEPRVVAPRVERVTVGEGM